MKKVPQDMMCVLLQTLLDKELISREVYDKSREKILSTLDWPCCFRLTETAGKEHPDGSA